MAVDTFSVVVHSGGSNTAASGCGPATAVSGTGASITNGATTVNLSADNPDLSAVVASDLLWVQSSTGRQWTRIVSVDNSTKIVTIGPNNLYGATESGRLWGIGGKRATLQQLDNFFVHRNTASYVGDMTNYGVIIEDDQTVTSRLPSIDQNHAVTNLFVGRGAGGVRPLITCSQAAGQPAFRQGWNGGSNWIFVNLRFRYTNKASTDRFMSGMNSNVPFLAINCQFGESGDSTRFFNDVAPQPCTMIGCDVYCQRGFGFESNTGIYNFFGCSFKSTGGILLTNRNVFTIDSCVFTGFANVWSGYAGLGSYHISNSVFDSISSNVFVDTKTDVNQFFYVLANNSFSNCGRVFNFVDPLVGNPSSSYQIFNYKMTPMRLNNNYYNVTTIGDTLKASETQLNPQYADSVNGNYRILNPAMLTGGGYPGMLNGFSAVTSIGPYSGGGGGVRMVNIRGGADQ